jgi:oxygen-independent coproporphyrinogen-3 oxidase
LKGQPDSSYIDLLLRDFEAELPLIARRRVDTIFFGGGTPSLFNPEDFARLLHAVRQRIDVDDAAEITLEANPGTVERGRFDGYRDAGINRVSLGAQTFAPRALSRLGRIHSAEDTHRAVEELRTAGIANFNLDLMYALPEQSFDEALEDVTIACSLGPSHLSYYQLTLEPGTVFHTRPPPLPDDEAAWRIQTACQAVLEGAGYRQYEVSAYAREGAQCRHNLNYWRFGDYLGLGAGAHGKLSLELPAGVLRTAKPKQPRDYQAQVAAHEGAMGARSFVAPRDLPFEFMLNALRLHSGFTAALFEARTGLPFSVASPTVERARQRQLMEQVLGVWRPTELGRRFLNDLQELFLA